MKFNMFPEPSSNRLSNLTELLWTLLAVYHLIYSDIPLLLKVPRVASAAATLHRRRWSTRFASNRAEMAGVDFSWGLVGMRKFLLHGSDLLVWWQGPGALTQKIAAWRCQRQGWRLGLEVNWHEVCPFKKNVIQATILFFCGTDMLKVSKSHQIGPSLNVRMTSAFEVLPKAALRRAPQQQWKATSRYALVETAHEI